MARAVRYPGGWKEAMNQFAIVYQDGSQVETLRRPPQTHKFGHAHKQQDVDDICPLLGRYRCAYCRFLHADHLDNTHVQRRRLERDYHPRSADNMKRAPCRRGFLTRTNELQELSQ